MQGRRKGASGFVGTTAYLRTGGPSITLWGWADNTACLDDTLQRAPPLLILIAHCGQNFASCVPGFFHLFTSDHLIGFLF